MYNILTDFIDTVENKDRNVFMVRPFALKTNVMVTYSHWNSLEKNLSTTDCHVQVLNQSVMYFRLSPPFPSLKYVCKINIGKKDFIPPPLFTLSLSLYNKYRFCFSAHNRSLHICITRFCCCYPIPFKPLNPLLNLYFKSPSISPTIPLPYMSQIDY